MRNFLQDIHTQIQTDFPIDKIMEIDKNLSKEDEKEFRALRNFSIMKFTIKI